MNISKQDAQLIVNMMKATNFSGEILEIATDLKVRMSDFLRENEETEELKDVKE